MLDPLLLGLLVAAIAIGWWLGRRERRRAREQPAPGVSLPRDYFIGLNHLLNEQPDRAIETFVQALEVNSDTIETHIALGNLFRSRGEADRAVKIHQNLLARPTLTPHQGGLVQLELSRDFLHLGLLNVLDRTPGYWTCSSDVALPAGHLRWLPPVRVVQIARQWWAPR